MVRLKDVHANIFQSIGFWNFLLQSDNESFVSEMPKKFGVTNFVSEIKGVD